MMAQAMLWAGATHTTIKISSEPFNQSPFYINIIMFYKNTDGNIMADRKIFKEEDYLLLEVQLLLHKENITRINEPRFCYCWPKTWQKKSTYTLQKSVSLLTKTSPTNFLLSVSPLLNKISIDGSMRLWKTAWGWDLVKLWALWYCLLGCTETCAGVWHSEQSWNHKLSLWAVYCLKSK